jgi:tetratricopeptide (TPR) repeat protein
MSRALVLAAVAALSGCQTYVVRDPGGKSKVELVQEDPESAKRTDTQIRDMCEKDPENPRNWFILGDYWERRMDYVQASDAYERMNALIEKDEVQHNTHYTGGHFQLGKIYALAGRYDLAIAHLGKVLEIQPKDVKVAVLNSQFAEAHFLLGAIFHIHHQWRDAKKHFEDYVLLSGDNAWARARVEPYLSEIRREVE